MGLRSSIPARRAAVILLVVASVVAMTINRAIANASPLATVPFPASSLAPTPPPRVLLMGDSLMDQQGSAATYLLRQAGVDAKTIGLWGSGLLTVDQYDDGITKPSGLWLARAAHEIAHFDPNVVGVYLNHNYWPPYPRDAHGHVITDLWSRSGQEMIGQQARALITILRARGADVFFVAPVPEAQLGDPSPAAWDPIWHGYLPVLRALRVPVADTTQLLAAPDGLRVEEQPSCDGTPRRIHPRRDLHLTRFGASRAGTTLAEYVADIVHADLRGNAAPGDRTAALVPTLDGRGAWLVGCDGSVYHLGDATPLAGARARLAAHGGVVAAVPTPAGAGLWLVAADGTIANVGDAPLLAFATPPAHRLTGATGVPGHDVLWATDASGQVFGAGAAAPAGPIDVPPGERVVGIAATPDGRGAWLATGAGHVLAVGDAPALRSPTASAAPVVGIAATPDGRGCWLVRTDGVVVAAGEAPLLGTAIYQAPPYPYNVVNAPPGPAAGIVAAPGSDAGYWVFGTTGRLVARGRTRDLRGDNNLALFTP